eukprot:Hpha_TRINITY_DN1154_c0_g1::TRINITY_DN1154_c0_g1_i1::g.113154::m.113154
MPTTGPSGLSGCRQRGKTRELGCRPQARLRPCNVVPAVFTRPAPPPGCPTVGTPTASELQAGGAGNCKVDRIKKEDDDTQQKTEGNLLTTHRHVILSTLLPVCLCFQHPSRTIHPQLLLPCYLFPPPPNFFFSVCFFVF